MTAYCGLVCSDCVRYRSEIIDAAKTLLTKLDDGKFHHYANVKKEYEGAFEKYPVFIEVLQKIIGLECRQSCRIGGGCSSVDCQIVKCCLEKQYQGCWECDRLSICHEFDFLKPFHGETPKNNCMEIRNNGFDDFPSRKHVFYVWDE